MRTQFAGAVGEIDSLPGCSQIGVSHSVFVLPDNRGHGVGGMANSLRTTYMKETLGYDYALCTVDTANKAQIKILQKNNWDFHAHFISSKTGHKVALYGKHLNV